MEQNIQKGDVDGLASRIVSIVEKISSPEHHVIKRFLPLLNEAKELSPEIEEKLRSFLLEEEKDDSCKKASDQFTYLRQILEKIVELCKNDGIIPYENEKLNDIKYFVGRKGHNNGTKPKEGVWPPVIASYIESMIDILQDGSHKVRDLRLHVSDYVIENNTPFLFRSCLYQIMELIRWLKATQEKIIKGELHKPLYVIHTAQCEKVVKNSKRIASSV